MISPSASQRGSLGQLGSSGKVGNPGQIRWNNRSFRGYADYMQSSEFAENVQRVAELATTERCVLMCAEAVPWRCHRSLIGDALLVRGIGVEDIIGPGKRKPHTLTTFAHVDGMQVTYPVPVDVARQAVLQLGSSDEATD
jgi:uncharacterized protein (DUF488 family)